MGGNPHAGAFMTQLFVVKTVFSFAGKFLMFVGDI
jgi:hypothetical protein